MMMPVRRCLLLAVIVVLVASVGWWLHSRTYAGPPVTPTPLPPALHENLVTTTLDNGLRLVLAPLSGHPTVTISVRVGVGLVHDPPQKSGLAHLYEHMVFRQRDDHSGFGSAELAAFGGTTWAWTREDTTEYYVTLPAERMAAGIDWITDSVIRADLPAEHLPHEREVVLREMDERTHDQLLFHTARAAIYGSHPYARTGLGDPATVAAITHRDLLHWRGTYYVANNMTVVMAGGFDPTAAHDYLHASLGGLQAVPLPVLEFADPPSPEAGRVQVSFQGTADELAVAWLGPRYTDSSFHDLIALDVAMDILTVKQFGVHDFLDDLASPPRRSLRLLGPSAFIHAGNFSAGTLAGARRGILLGLRAVRTGLIARRTFGLAKNARLAQMAEYHQSSLAVAEALGYFATATGNPRHLFDYVDRLRGLRIMDVTRAARRYLAPSARLEVSLISDSSDGTPRATERTALRHAAGDLGHYLRWHLAPEIADTARDLIASSRRLANRLRAAPGTGAPVQHPEAVPAQGMLTLHNGVRIILRPDPATHVTVVHAMVGAGSAVEGPKQAGLSWFTSQFLLRGTATRSGDNLMRHVADVGALLAAYSGRDVAGLALAATADTWQVALPILLDALLNPAFEQVEFYRLWGDIDWERELNRSTPSWPVLPALQQFLPVLFPDGGYGNPRLGTEASLGELELKDVRDFYRRHFVAENLVVVAVGNFDPDLLGGFLIQELGRLDRRTPPGETAPEPDSYWSIDRSEPETVRGVQHGALAWVLTGFPAPGAVSDDYAAMLVLDVLLGSGESNRLATAVRDDRGLAYTVGSYFPITARDGYLAAYAGVVPDAVDTALATMRATIADIAAGGVSTTELATAKTAILREHAASGETADLTAYWLGWFELAGAGYAWHDEMPARFRAVSLDDVHRVARRYLQKHITSILTPPADSD